jgi:hypothetical protein
MMRKHYIKLFLIAALVIGVTTIAIENPGGFTRHSAQNTLKGEIK